MQEEAKTTTLCFERTDMHVEILGQLLYVTFKVAEEEEQKSPPPLSTVPRKLTWIWVCTCGELVSFWAWEMGVVRNWVFRVGWVAYVTFCGWP